jgi:hypothetical protein
MVDGLFGMLALACIVFAALLLGGFSFFTPWLIACPITTLVAGLLRYKQKAHPFR